MTSPRSQSADAPLKLEVEGADGVKISAIVWSTELTSRHVSGIVEWHGTKLLSSIVSAEGDESRWRQRFLLVWAAAGPQSVAAVPLLGAAQWHLARLTLPDLDGQPGDTVQVSLNRRSWTASLSSTRRTIVPTDLPIALELQHLDVGSILADMASRLLLRCKQAFHVLRDRPRRGYFVHSAAFTAFPVHVFPSQSPD